MIKSLFRSNFGFSKFVSKKTKYMFDFLNGDERPLSV